MNPILELTDVCKTFTLHTQGGTRLGVLERVNLRVSAGECVVLDGPSGQGKSSLLKLIYGNYLATSGRVVVRAPGHAAIDITTAEPRAVVRMRREQVGYVSQFLRVIPRVGALDVVAQPLLDAGHPVEEARRQAAEWLSRLRIPPALWPLPPATFSGGEQQRVNIARSLIRPRPLLLLDEPTASLDATNTATVIELIQEALGRGAAVVGIFHDRAVRDALGTRRIDMRQYQPKPQPRVTA